MKRLLLSSFLLLGATTAMAQPAQLAPELQQKLRDVRQRHAGQAKPVRQDLRAAYRALRDELARPQASDATLRQLEDQVAADQQKLRELHAQVDSELRAQLTPREYAQVMMVRGARHAHGRPGRRGHAGAATAP